jgi:hypothetical protein
MTPNQALALTRTAEHLTALFETMMISALRAGVDESDDEVEEITDTESSVMTPPTSPMRTRSAAATVPVSSTSHARTPTTAARSAQAPATPARNARRASSNPFSPGSTASPASSAAETPTRYLQSESFYANVPVARRAPVRLQAAFTLPRRVYPFGDQSRVDREGIYAENYYAVNVGFEVGVFIGWASGAQMVVDGCPKGGARGPFDYLSAVRHYQQSVREGCVYTVPYLTP